MGIEMKCDWCYFVLNFHWVRFTVGLAALFEGIISQNYFKQKEYNKYKKLT